MSLSFGTPLPFQVIVEDKPMPSYKHSMENTLNIGMHGALDLGQYILCETEGFMLSFGSLAVQEVNSISISK